MSKKLYNEKLKEIDLKEEKMQGAIKATGRVSLHRKRQLEVLRQEASRLRIKYEGEELICKGWRKMYG